MRVMIVEDDALLALMLEDIVYREGHEVTGVANDVATARMAAAIARPDLALVDCILTDGPTGVTVARSLADDGVSVCFVTSSRSALPADLTGAVGLVEKPYTPDEMQAVLRFLTAAVMGNGATPPPPGSLLLAPGRVVEHDGRFA